MSHLLSIEKLTLAFLPSNPCAIAVENCSLHIDSGEMLALVGESGSGKSLTALAIMGLLPPNAHATSGSITFQGQNLLSLQDEALNQIRGSQISMIFQEPMTALNPVLTIGWQIQEILRQHTQLSPEERNAKAIELLTEVGIPSPEKRISEYPHQLSGGMRQRIVIAMALACAPKLIIADEPTTALDVTVQAQIMALLNTLRKKTGAAVLLITHNLALVRQQADRVAVMYAGHIVETAPTEQLFSAPVHPYTQLLLAAIPSASARGTALAAIQGQVPAPAERLPGCRFQPRCPYADTACATPQKWQNITADHGCLCCNPNPQPCRQAKDIKNENTPHQNPLLSIEHLKVYFPVEKNLLGQPKCWLKAVNDISLTLYEGETLAVVGESGCGKTTLGKAIIGLNQPTSGSIRLGDSPNLATLSASKLKPYRKQMAMVFQDPFSSLDPRMMLEDTIAEGLNTHHLHIADRNDFLHSLAQQVGLPADALQRYPHQFSGGQRQRVGLARALALEPKLIICDECTSALDVSVQAQILNLLSELKSRLHLTFLFITHDLSVVSYIADRIAIMYLGQLMEIGSAKEILESPAHPYTRCLLAAAPQIDGGTANVQPPKGEIPSPIHPPAGCPFHPRCPLATSECSQAMPGWTALSASHQCRCAKGL